MYIDLFDHCFVLWLYGCTEKRRNIDCLYEGKEFLHADKNKCVVRRYTIVIFTTVTIKNKKRKRGMSGLGADTLITSELSDLT